MAELPKETPGLGGVQMQLKRARVPRWKYEHDCAKRAFLPRPYINFEYSQFAGEVFSNTEIMSTAMHGKEMTSVGPVGARTNIDRRNCKRVVPMKVLCLGLGRTGTSCRRTKSFI